MIRQALSYQQGGGLVPSHSAGVEKILAVALDRGIIIVDDVVALDKESLMKKIIETYHDRPISQAKDGRYYTYVPDPTKKGGRKQVRGATKEKLYENIAKEYGLIAKTRCTIAEAYAEWVEYKRTFTTAKYKPMSPSTIRRYERDYARLIRGTSLEKAPITIDAHSLKVELISIVQEKQVSPSDFSNFFGYLNMMFDMLMDAGRISASPIGRTTKKEVKAFCTEKPQKPDEDRVLTKEELERLRKAVVKQIRKHPRYMPNYAILLATYTGMRVGEIAALRWVDIRDGVIHVDCSEHRHDYPDHYELVIGEPKNGKHRAFPINEAIQGVLDMIKDAGADSEWLFANKDGVRHTAHDISCAADRRAKEAGIGGTSIHEIRRTVSSLLRTRLARETVAAMLGHLPETNDRHYDYDVAGKDEKVIAITDVLSSNVISFASNKKIAEAR